MKTIAITKDIQGIHGKLINGPDGKPIDTKEAMRLLILNLPNPKLSMNDSIQAHKIYPIIEQSVGEIKLEDEHYKWLMSMVDQYAPIIFGVHAIMIKEAFEKKKDPDLEKKPKK